ncbi:MAG: DUF2339 domain-containing protein, partial [Myxococcales bacterium]|nr:DUF2339 domain-containing protein [Myxococcales bacterium]
MLASSAYEAVWLSAHASSGIAPLHVAIVIVFAALFAAVPAFSAESVAEPPTSPARLMRLAAMAVPFLFALELVSHPAVVAAPMPIGALLVSVTLLACGLARARREPHGLMLVALGSLAILYAWSRQAILADHVPAIAGLALALALPFVVLALVERRTLGLVRDRAGAAGATMIAALTLLLAVAAATSKAPSPLALGVLTLLAGAGLALSRWAGVTSFASVSLAGGAGTLGLVGGSALVFSGETRPAILSLLASLALATLGAWLARRDERRGPLAASVAAWVEAVRSGVTVASIAPAVLLLPLAERLPLLLFGGLLAASVASGMAHAYRAPLAHTRIALVLGAPLAAFALRGHADTSALVIVAACLALAVIAASFSTRLCLAGHAATPLANSAVIVCGAAAIALRMADSSDAGALTTSVAVTASGVLLASWHLAPTSRAEAERWLGGLAVTAATVSMVLLLRNEELTWGLSLLGLALLGLGTKLRRDAAVVVGVIHLGVVAVRLLANPWVLGYHPRGDVALLNWITPTYLVPTLAMAAGWWLLSQPNADDLESDHHLVRRILAGLALTLPFAWLNLTVIDIYASGPWLSLAGAASDGRNLSISAVWASYGVGLLLLGLARKSVPLRWASLALILVTAGKVFMYDLGNLRDLYRVASLAGLAISLLAISVLYQRFVFGPSAKEKVVRAS